LDTEQLQPDIGNLYLEGCPCRDILDLIGSKWSVLVIGRLEEGPHRFGELRRAVPGITQKMLTQTLRRLEEDGMVDRKVLAEMRPPRVEYSLTKLGRTLTQPLAAIRDWTESHLPEVREARDRFAQQLEAADI
jgi:DNA-binding HxlR family transcriptional regulator